MVLLIVFVVLAIPWTYFNITLGLKLERELQAIRDRGEPLTLEQALPEMPPRDENAAYVYEQAFRIFQKWTPTPEGAVPGVPLSELSPQTRDGEVHGSRARETPVGPAAVQEFADGKRKELPEDVRDWLYSAEIDHRLDAIRRASEMERAVFPINWEDGFATIFPQLSQFRQAEHLVVARMMIEGREGHTGEALQWCRVGLRLTEHLDQEPTLLAFLVRVAMVEILSKGAQGICNDIAVPSARARALSSIADGDGLWQHFRRALEGERASGLLIFGPIDGDTIDDLLGGGFAGPSLLYWELYESFLGAPVRKYDQLQFLDLWSVMLERADHPWREVSGHDVVLEHFGQAGLVGVYLEPVTRALLPVFGIVQVKRDTAIARLDQFHIALALNLYRQAHGGYPETLAPLAEVVDWPIPDDIFSGEAFRYRREGEGFVLWSLGPDLDDDGGHDFREEGRSWDDSDIVWRVER